MTTLIPPSAEKCALIDEAARQEKTGEMQAFYWHWLDSSGRISYSRNKHDVSYKPSPSHPHYATYCHWQQLVDDGEVAKGWWINEVAHPSNYVCQYNSPTENISWWVNCQYKIIKTGKHPDNTKPALKLIDWHKVPLGAMTSMGVIIHNQFNGIATVPKTGIYCWETDVKNMRLLEQTTFTHLPQGIPPPVVEGLVFEYEYCGEFGRDVDHIPYVSDMTISCIAYRVIGLAPGYTDNPEKAK
jgi:hypothetical protein